MHPCLLRSQKLISESRRPLEVGTEQDVHVNDWKTFVGVEESEFSVLQQKRGEGFSGSRVGYTALKGH